MRARAGFHRDGAGGAICQHGQELCACGLLAPDLEAMAILRVQENEVLAKVEPDQRRGARDDLREKETAQSA